MAYVTYSNCSTITTGCYLYYDIYKTLPVASGYYSDLTNCYYVDAETGYVSAVTSCPSYDNYNADRYDCSTCNIISSGYQVALPGGTTPDYSNYYIPNAGSGEQGVYFYQITSTSSGPGIVCDATAVSTCGAACPVP